MDCADLRRRIVLITTDRVAEKLDLNRKPSRGKQKQSGGSLVLEWAIVISPPNGYRGFRPKCDITSMGKLGECLGQM